jgi:hypothetical protein
MESVKLTPQNLFEEHKKLKAAIYDYDYYVATFERAKDSFILDESNGEEICGFWSHFWYMLPHSLAIQREPFYRICDFAEGKYLFTNE